MIAILSALFALAFIVGVFALAIGIIALISKSTSTAKRCGFVFGTCLALVVMSSVLVVLISPADSGKVNPVDRDSRSGRAIVLNRKNAQRPIRFPAYLALHRGLHVILDSNNEGDGTNATLFDNLATVQKWANGESDPTALPHHDLPIGTRVRVNSWKRVNSTLGDDRLMIDVATLSGTPTQGYVQDTGVLPDIPRGAELLAQSANGFALLEHDQTKANTYAKLANGTQLTLIDEHPSGSSVSPFRVVVKNGPNRGMSGWMSALGLAAPSAPANVNTYDAKCHCTEVYVVDTSEGVASLAGAAVSSPPALGPVSDDDKAYMKTACDLMYPNGTGYGFDFGDGGNENANLRVVTCAGESSGQLMYFRTEHRAETKDQYVHDSKPAGVAGGYEVPAPGSDATPFPERN